MADLFTVELGIYDEKTRRAFEEILASREFQPQFRLQSPSDDGAPDLVILEMQRSYREVLQRAASIRRNAPQAEIFVTSLRNEPEELLQLFREDINDFIQLPVKDYEVKQSFERFLQRSEQAEQSSSQLGKVLNVMGAKGGIGTTTIAINLAVSLKKKDAKRRVVLVDLDYQFGDIALFLNLQPNYSITHVAQHMAQNDKLILQKEFMQGVLEAHDSGVNVLSAARVDEDRELVTPDTVNKTVDVLRSMYDYVILDSGHVLDDITVEMMHRIPALYLVSTLHLPAIRNTDRFLKYLASFDPRHHENTHIIMNRRGSMYEEISIKQFTREYQKDVFFTIPNDYSTASNLLNQGKTINTVFRWNKLAKSFRRLAAKVA